MGRSDCLAHCNQLCNSYCDPENKEKEKNSSYAFEQYNFIAMQKYCIELQYRGRTVGQTHINTTQPCLLWSMIKVLRVLRFARLDIGSI